MSIQNTYLIDTTLRDGEQTPGVAFSLQEKIKIAGLLDELGVDEVEAGTPAIGKEEAESIRVIAAAGFKFKTSSWCRADMGDIVHAARLGTQCVNISLPVSNIQISTLGKTHSWVMEQMGEVVPVAKGLFSHVTLGAQDASRSNPDFLREFISLANDMQIDRMRVADTVGIFDPMETFQFIKDIKTDFPFLQLEFHGHNDFGMATANAISALKAGGDCVSATVNGLGERAGNSALEEIIAYLHVKRKVSRFNTRVIGELCDYVARLANCPIPHQKAITGKNAFRHESGIHTAAILKNVKSYQILEPEDFGVGQTNIVFGKHSGKASIMGFFRSAGIEVSERIAGEMLKMIKQNTKRYQEGVGKIELLRIYEMCAERSVTAV
jgi:homocitrate synthase NifV